MSTNGVMTITPTIIESLVMRGDLSGLTPYEKVEYYKFRCSQLDIDPAEQPFQLLRLNGKEVLYATKACTDALCRSRQLKRELTSRERIEDVYVVTCRCSDPNGRFDEATGAVNVAGLQGEILANALMKCETKAKRRAVLSLCGLGMLDESELDTIQGAQPIPMPLPVSGDALGEAPHVSLALAMHCGSEEHPTVSERREARPGLTPKREAWLRRVAQEGHVAQDVVQRCMDFLRGAGPQKVTEFFDEMARKKVAVFAPFQAAS